MEIIKGIGISSNILFGHCVFLKRDVFNVEYKQAKSFDFEMEKYKKAVDITYMQLEKLYLNSRYVNPDDAIIIKAHQFMLTDEEFLEQVKENISKMKCSCEYAVIKATEYFVRLLGAVDDAYIRGRVSDLKEVSATLINNLNNRSINLMDSLHNVLNDQYKNKSMVVALTDILVTDIFEFYKANVKGFITKKGCKTSHASILAQSFGLIAIINASGNLETCDNKSVIISGSENLAILEPDFETLRHYKLVKKESDKESVKLKELINSDSITKDGYEVRLMVNVSNLDDIEKALKNCAHGVGLFRSEFLYMDKINCPSEQEQFAVYKDMAKRLGNKPIIIRTLDVGFDKTPKCLNILESQNSVMGERGIRFCLKNINIFKQQLKALLRASVYGNLKIMLPMITSVDEVKKTKDILNFLKRELDLKNIQYNKSLEIGVMIETPAAVMISDELAKHVNFFSVGTNDLIQFVFARDRNYGFENGFDNKVILRMIKIAQKAAETNNILIGICGAYASDISLLKDIIGLGINQLSVDSESILRIKKALKDINFKEQKEEMIKKLQFI